MAGDAFVIRGRLDRQRETVLEITGVDAHVARSRPVGRAREILGAGGLLLTIFLGRKDLDLGLRQPAEKPGHVALELRGVLLVEIEDLLPRLRMKRRVLLDRGVERLEIVETELLRDPEHLAFDPRDLAKADLMDLLRRQI